MATKFNPFSKEFREDPYRTYSVLQQSPPVRTLGMWIVTKYNDVWDVLKDRRFSSALIPSIAEKRLKAFSADCPEVAELGRKSIVFTDNPDHARLRRLANLVFNQPSINALRLAVTTITRQLLDVAVDRDSVDIVSAVTAPLPIKVLAAWMGLQDGDVERISRWTHAIRFFLEPGVVSQEVFQESYAILLEYMDFFRAEIARRKANPGNDMITLLLKSKVQADAYSDEEIIYFCIMAYVAGGETTQALLGNATLLLARHPDQLALLRSGKVSIKDAANEIFRYESPLQMTKRLCMEDMTIAGVEMAKGDQVLLCIGAANRDPAVFSEPDKFAVDRTNSAQHIAFGHGIHACLGAYLAEIQIETYLNAIITRDIQFAISGPAEWVDHTLLVRGLKRLDMTVSTGQALCQPS